MLRIPLCAIADLLPEEHLLRPIHEGETIDLPAGHILSHIVPTLSLSLLAELKPDLIEPVGGVVRLPAHRIAMAYTLLETTDATLPEPDEFLFRDEIPSPSAHLGKIIAHFADSAGAAETLLSENTEAEAETESALRRRHF